jgi:Bacterial protein of unknown function (DUF916)/Protein of unknown function C-terminal (DUF3324)
MQNSFFFPRSGFYCRLIIGTCLLTILILVGLLVPSLGFSIAHAASGQPNFALQPVLYDPSNSLTKSYFILDSNPGIVVKSSVRVTNAGTATGSVALYPVDATTAQTSGAVYLDKKDPRRDVGAWITLGIQQLTLNPGQSQVVPFRIIIPGTVLPGQHLGGIVAENLAQEQNSTKTQNGKNTGTFQIIVKHLTVIAVQVNLPGTPVEQLAAAGVQSGGENGYQSLQLGLSNTGNVMVKPYGSLQITDSQRQVVKDISLKLDTFLPQTSINYPVYIKGQALNVGDYQATLNLTYGPDNKVLHYTTKFSITQKQLTQTFSSSQTQAPPGLFNGDSSGLSPWLIISGGLVLLLILGSLLYWFVLIPRAKAKAMRAVTSSQFIRPSKFK